jgi:hypothetical protein
MKNSIKICFDGNKYLVLDSLGKAWGEGATLDEAYIVFRSKTSEETLLIKSRWQLTDISLVWLSNRKMIIAILVTFALVYAQVAVFLKLPSYVSNYVSNALGETYVDKVVSVSDKVTDKLNKISDADKEKINLSLGRLHTSLCQFTSVINCAESTDLKK